MTAILCDLGGTNSRFGLAVGDTIEPQSLFSFANDDFDDFPAVLAAYRERLGKPAADAVCIALAAPATPDGAVLTNRDWDIRRCDVARVSGTSNIHFINDFQALGLSLLGVERLATRLLHPGDGTYSKGPRLVLGAGTGFNAAACFPSPAGGAPTVPAAECGHMTLPTRGEEEASLQASLAEGRTRASVERALSGNGLFEIYLWCCRQSGREPCFAKPPEIAAQAVLRTDPDCEKAVDLLLRFFGRVAGDLALAFLPMGGIFLSGGVTRALAPLIEETPTFLQAFHAKGRQSAFMERFSISLLLDDRAALAGCAQWLRSQPVVATS